MAYEGCKGMSLLYVFDKVHMAKIREKCCFTDRRRYLLMDHPFMRNKITFDGKQELECAPEVPSGEEILKQLEGMVFGDESAGKTPKPPKSTKKNHKKKKRKKKRRWRRGRGIKKRNKKNQRPLKYCGKKKNIFFRLPYWKDNLLRHNLDVMHIEKNCDGQHTWHNTRH